MRRVIVTTRSHSLVNFAALRHNFGKMEGGKEEGREKGEEGEREGWRKEGRDGGKGMDKQMKRGREEVGGRRDTSTQAKTLRLDIAKYLLLKVVSTYSLSPLKERTRDNGVKCVAGIIFRSPPNLGWLIS